MQEDLRYKTLLEKYKADISQDVIDFVNSPDFEKFKRIMEQLYISKLESLQNESEDKDILISQRVLNIYSNLPNVLKLMEQQVLSNRRDEKDLN